MTTRGIAITLILSAVTIVASYAAFLIFITWPISEISINKAGVYGDSFGILTSLFSALAFTGMIITILLQKDELSLQRQELFETRQEISAQKEILRTQNFDNAFYRLLDYYKHNLSEISVRSKDKTVKFSGIGALRHLLHKFKKSQSEYNKYFSQHSAEKMKIYKFHLCLDVHRILLKQARYLGTFKSLLKLVDSRLETEEEKSVYWDIINSQLTAYEVQYIYYQSLVDINGEFSQIINKTKFIQERIRSVGVRHSVKVAYEQLHGVPIGRTIRQGKLPYDREEITKIKLSLGNK